MHCILGQFFHVEVVETDKYRLSSLSTYYVPPDGPLSGYKEFVKSEFPDQDKPEAFGQHANADISAQIDDSIAILDTLLSLQPRVASSNSCALLFLVIFFVYLPYILRILLTFDVCVLQLVFLVRTWS